MDLPEYWHPVFRASRLKAKPVAVRLAGRPLVLFRSPDGIGALDDMCCHRRMRLSVGHCRTDGRIVCAYHGWSFDCSGNGESPGTPRLHAHIGSYDVREAYGLIWVKTRGVEAVFPSLDDSGYRHMCTLEHRVHAPLELALDNFQDIEHTSVQHRVFGYELSRMREVQMSAQSTGTAVIVRSSGPAKPIPLFSRLLFGVRRSHWWHSDWVTTFTPVSSVIDHWWADPNTGGEALIRWRAILFFTPVEEQETIVWTFAYARSRWLAPGGGLREFRWFMQRTMDQEIRTDLSLVHNLASRDPSLAGMKLGRFDRAMGLNRDGIERIYRKRSETVRPDRPLAS